MTVTQSGPGRARYLVVSVDDSVSLAPLLASVADDAGVRIIDRIGPPGQPHTAVLELSHDRARALETQFQQARQPYKIEPDSPLSLSGRPQ